MLSNDSVLSAEKQSSDFDKWSTLGQKKSWCWFSYGIDFYLQKRVQNKQNDQRVGDIHALGFSFCTRPDSHWGLAEGYSKSLLITSLSSSTSSIIRFLSSLSLYLVGLYTVFFSFWARSARSESEEKATVESESVSLLRVSRSSQWDLQQRGVLPHCRKLLQQVVLPCNIRNIRR